MKRNVRYYIFLFLTMAIIGWISEFLFMLIVKHRIVNGGFLLGPWTPIYGWGCLLMAIVFKNEKSNNKIVFLKSIFYCSILEYFTSFILEKIFMKNWWDYSCYFLNINGRICLFSCLVWGVLGLVYIRKVEPFIFKKYNKFEEKFIKNYLVLLVILYVFDSAYSIVMRLP